jgi:hypothetical protein
MVNGWYPRALIRRRLRATTFPRRRGTGMERKTNKTDKTQVTIATAMNGAA